jgi:ADP-heptose:LPS heptosyltransferase
MSLPRAFRTTLAMIPNHVPYLTVPADRLPLWRDRLGEKTRRRIAFAWSGSKGGPWNRDMPLSALLPLLQRDDCEWHVAQRDVEDDDRRLLEQAPNVIDHSRTLQDFADTAALVSQMDLVISVDTALVHLAGALAHPVWTLLPLGADYRWLMHRDDSPWYPTMRLFRQPRLKDWPAVVSAVAGALDTLGA